MLSATVKKSMDKSVLCWLATASLDGQPNVSPKEIFTYYQDEFILIANIASPNSLRNIKANPQVSVSFIDILVQKGFQVKGKASIVSKTNENFTHLHAPLFAIAGPGFPFASIILIQVEQIKPIIAPRYMLYPDTTEEEQIASAKKTYGFL